MSHSVQDAAGRSRNMNISVPASRNEAVAVSLGEAAQARIEAMVRLTPPASGNELDENLVQSEVIAPFDASG